MPIFLLSEGISKVISFPSECRNYCQRLDLHNICHKTPSPLSRHLQVLLYKVTSNQLDSIYNCQYLLSRICHPFHSPNPQIEQFPPSIPKDSQNIQVYLSQFHLLHQQSKKNQQGEEVAPWKLTFHTCKCLYHCTWY